MATLGLLKIKLFWNKGYGLIIYINDVTNQILSRDSNCIAVVVMREIIITSILYWFDQKNHFFWGVVLVEVQ